MALTNFIHPHGELKFAKITAASSGANEVVAAVTGKRIRVVSYLLSAAGTVNAKWQSASTDLTGLHYMVANNQVPVPFSPVGYFETASGEALNLNLSGAIAVGGHVAYIEV